MSSNREDETENEETKISDGPGRGSEEKVPRMVIVIKNIHEREVSKGIQSRTARVNQYHQGHRNQYPKSSADRR